MIELLKRTTAEVVERYKKYKEWSPLLIEFAVYSVVFSLVVSVAVSWATLSFFPERTIGYEGGSAFLYYLIGYGSFGAMLNGIVMVTTGFLGYAMITMSDDMKPPKKVKELLRMVPGQQWSRYVYFLLAIILFQFIIDLNVNNLGSGNIHFSPFTEDSNYLKVKFSIWFNGVLTLINTYLPYLLLAYWAYRTQRSKGFSWKEIGTPLKVSLLFAIIGNACYVEFFTILNQVVINLVKIPLKNEALVMIAVYGVHVLLFVYSFIWIAGGVFFPFKLHLEKSEGNNSQE